MIAILTFASTLGQIFKPLYEAMAWIIAVFYAVIPNFAIAIAGLTIVVMIVTAPLTVKSTRSTIKMQRVAPELKKIQQKYKGDRVALNEEMMKLYKEHGINPAGGCLPMLIQLPVFIVLYGVIRGLTNTVKLNGHLVGRPDYVSHSTRLYRDLVVANGHMKAFGLDLGNNLFSHHSWVAAIPYGAIVAVAIALQYLQMRQLNSRNPGAAQANPQMQMIQRYMPLIFAVIYIRISAGVNIYFVVSSLCRIGIQEAIFRSGVLDKAPTKREGILPSRGGEGTAPRRKSIMERLADAQQRALEQRAQQAGLQAELDAPRAPNAGASGPKAGASGPKAGASGPKAGASGPKKGPSNTTPEDAVGTNSGASPNGAPKPNGAAKRPTGSQGGGAKQTPKSSSNGGAQRGSPKAGSNGAPAPKGQPQGQPRSAKKRPRKAR
jgi:YidC/Oxa1 family membrane protein insertase